MDQNKELIDALRVAHDHLLMNNQTHTRTYRIVNETLNKHDSNTDYVGPYGNGVSLNESIKTKPNSNYVGPYGNGVPFGH